MRFPTLVSKLALCVALGATGLATTPVFSQTEAGANTAEDADSSDSTAPRNLRDLRAALNEDISADERQQVFTELEMLGEDGDAGALMTLGNALRSEGEIARAISAFEAAAELDEMQANVVLMRLLGDEDSPFFDLDRASEFMLDAAAAGHVGAQIALASALLDGKGMDADPAQARQILSDLASENAIAAQQAGNLARDGVGGPVDGAEAARLYRMAAESGRAAAWLPLGAMLLTGEIIDRDPAGALEAFQNAADGTHDRIAERARILLLRGHATEAFEDLSDPSQIAPLASEPLEDGNIGIARFIVSSASDLVPDEALARALEILEEGADDGNQGSAASLFAYWLRERDQRSVEATRELNRIMDMHSDLLPERATLRFKIDTLAPPARSAAQFQELTDLLMSASPEELPIAFIVLRRHNVNAYVYVVQSFLETDGYYTGAKNGLLTGATITAINRFCADAGISRECALGPLRGNVVRSIGTALAER